MNTDNMETTEVRYAADALRKDPHLDEALNALARQGVTSLDGACIAIAVPHQDGKSTVALHTHVVEEGTEQALCIHDLSKPSE